MDQHRKDDDRRLSDPQQAAERKLRAFVAVPDGYAEMPPEEQEAARLEMARELQRQLGAAP